MMLIASVRYEGEIQVVKMILLQQRELMQMLSEATAIVFALSPRRRSSTRFARIFTAVKIAAVEDASRTDTGGGSPLFIGVLKF